MRYDGSKLATPGVLMLTVRLYAHSQDAVPKRAGAGTKQSDEHGVRGILSFPAAGGTSRVRTSPAIYGPCRYHSGVMRL